jgi:hypothetical protein
VQLDADYTSNSYDHFMRNLKENSPSRADDTAIALKMGQERQKKKLARANRVLGQVRALRTLTIQANSAFQQQYLQQNSLNKLSSVIFMFPFLATTDLTKHMFLDSLEHLEVQYLKA